MSGLPACPQCGQDNVYPDAELLVCADCGHEFTAAADVAQDETRVVTDSNGNVLTNGDAVILIKDLKVKGSSLVIKKGTKVKNIRIVEGDHDIDCKIDGVALSLKSEFLKKSS
ncbi:MAG: zinc ribbon domain-containing protein YjdM [Formosimonas sp.]